MTSPGGSGRTQRGSETKDDPKSAAWLLFEVRQQHQLLSRKAIDITDPHLVLLNNLIVL